MHDVVTVGMVVWTFATIGGFALVLGILAAILIVIGEGFKH